MSGGHSLGTFERLKEYRTNLGWEVKDLANKMPDGRPSESSIRRLENGLAIRIVSCHRVFDVINSAMGQKLDRTEEIRNV